MNGIMYSGQGKRPTIFLLEEDDETLRPLVENLRRDDYHVAVALNEEVALARVGGGHVHADLVLVDLAYLSQSR